MNCNICGSTNLIEGLFSEGGSLGTDAFVPNDESSFKKMLGIGGRKIRSYACVHCGNLQFVVNFSEDDKKRYLEFEGQQASVTEPIEEDDMLAEKSEVSE